MQDVTIKGASVTAVVLAIVIGVLIGFGNRAEMDGGKETASEPLAAREGERTGVAVPLYTEEDVVALARMAYGEALVTGSDTEMSACMWVALNRLDSDDAYYSGCQTVHDVVEQERQFHGYSPENPVDLHLAELARDVLERWTAEKRGKSDVGRTLPAEYMYFHGDGERNYFTTEYGGGATYDWSLESPYEN